MKYSSISRAGAARADLVAVRLERVEDRLVDLEVEARGEDDGAQHADRILEKARAGIADRSDQAALEILQAADVVDDREGRDVVEQRVDGEVAAERVLFGRAERVVAMDEPFVRAHLARGACLRTAPAPRATRRARSASPAPPRALRPTCGASGGSSAGSTCRRNVATSIVFGPNLTCASRKRRPMIQQLRKSFLTWWGCADVPMSKSFGRRPEQEVTDAAADEIRDVIVLVQPVQDLECVGIDVAARDRVL